MSAIVGVACYQLIPDTFLAAGLAVGLAIGAMHLLGCIHPSGGATALVAVVGGPGIHALGFEYVLAPVFLNSLVIFLTATAFNSIFPWPHYPASLMRFTDKPAPSQSRPAYYIDRKHIEQALEDIDLVVDLTTDDLQRLFALTIEHAE